MEEDILCLFFACKIVNIIHNDNIHSLVKVYEIIDGIVFQGLYKLLAKLLARNIDHQLIW
ncbi:hypothetical protein D3C80_2106020 [compost metagenome]